jgi:hypothetical protein
MSKIQLSVVAVLALVCSVANAERFNLDLRGPVVKAPVESDQPVFEKIEPAMVATPVNVLVASATREMTSSETIRISSQVIDQSEFMLSLFQGDIPTRDQAHVADITLLSSL